MHKIDYPIYNYFDSYALIAVAGAVCFFTVIVLIDGPGLLQVCGYIDCIELIVLMACSFQRRFEKSFETVVYTLSLFYQNISTVNRPNCSHCQGLRSRLLSASISQRGRDNWYVIYSRKIYSENDMMNMR